MRSRHDKSLSEPDGIVEQGWKTTYSLRVPHRPPGEVMAAWLGDHDRFWPHHEARFRHPLAGVERNELDGIETTEAPVVLSNGVTVMCCDQSRFEYTTPPEVSEWGDHVSFGADPADDGSMVQVDVRTAHLRDAALAIRRYRKLDRLWTATLESMAHYLASPDGVVEVSRTKLRRSRSGRDQP